jgi:hypothetical protein
MGDEGGHDSDSDSDSDGMETMMMFTMSESPVLYSLCFRLITKLFWAGSNMIYYTGRNGRRAERVTQKCHYRQVALK